MFVAHCLFSIKFNTRGSHHNTNPGIVSLQMMFCLFLAFLTFRKLCKYPSVLRALLWESTGRNFWPVSQMGKWGGARNDLLKIVCPASGRNWIRTCDLAFKFVSSWVFVLIFVLQNECVFGWSDRIIFKTNNWGAATHHSILTHIGSSCFLHFSRNVILCTWHLYYSRALSPKR